MWALVFIAFIAYLLRLMPTVSGGTGASEWVTGALLTRGIGLPAGTAIAAGQTLTFDVDCAGDDQLDLFINMTGGVAGDLAVSVKPYRGSNNATIYGGMFAVVTRASGPTFSGAAISYDAQFDVSGFNKVQVSIQNNNVAGQVINEATWRLS